MIQTINAYYIRGVLGLSTQCYLELDAGYSYYFFHKHNQP